MSVLSEKTVEPQIQFRIKAGFHLHMAYACSALLLVTLVVGKLASLQFPNPLSLMIGLAFASAIVFTIAIYWHEKGKMDLRDATLTIPWVHLSCGDPPVAGFGDREAGFAAARRKPCAT